MPRNRRHECTNWCFISSHLSICALIGDETRVRTIRHVFIAFLWVKLAFRKIRIEPEILRTTVRCINRYTTNTLKLLKVSNEAKILHKVLLYPAIEKAQYFDLFVRLPMIYAERMKVTFRHENIKVSRRWRGSFPPPVRKGSLLRTKKVTYKNICPVSQESIFF